MPKPPIFAMFISVAASHPFDGSCSVRNETAIISWMVGLLGSPFHKDYMDYEYPNRSEPLPPNHWILVINVLLGQVVVEWGIPGNL